MKNPLNQIIKSIPAKFFKDLEEEVVVAFGQAKLLTMRQYELPEQKAMLAQNRHAFVEKSFRHVAAANGLEVFAKETTPKGGSFSFAKLGSVCFIRSNIQTHCGTPRPTKFRRAWAAINKWLSALQFDLLDETPEPDANQLCVMLIVSAEKSGNSDQSIPAFVGIGIPAKDLSGWLVRKSISEVLALYHDSESDTQPAKEPAVAIKDRAIPVLKKRSNSDDAK